MSNNLKLLSYNLLMSKAFAELKEVVVKERPDIVCVQEYCVSEEGISEMESLGYELADYSYSFFKFFKIFSVATFYNPKTVEYRDGAAIDLVRGLYEFILSIIRIGGAKRTALNNNFIFSANGQRFKVCTVHLSALQSTNRIRTQQLSLALNYLKEEPATPTVLIGDFNFMYHRKKLERLFKEFNYQEATSNLGYTMEWLILFFRLRTKPDYVWYRHLTKVSCERLPHRLSDHFPILAEFSF